MHNMRNVFIHFACTLLNYLQMRKKLNAKATDIFNTELQE